MFPLGWHVAAITRVGAALGANDAAGARRAARVAPACAAVCMTSIAAAILLGRHGFATVFTSAPSLQHGMANVMFANAAYVIVDGIQTALTGCAAARGGVPGA
jgi:Na+-driven multidrug efflux pump